MEIEPWTLDKWDSDKEAILAMEEKCFVPELRMDEDEILDSLDSAIAFVARENGKIIGMTYGNIYSDLDKEWFEGYFEPKDYKKYNEFRSLYITSTCVDPDYRSQDVCLRIRIEMINYCRNLNFHYFISHAHEGSMTNLYIKLGGICVATFHNWYGSEETHYLCEMDITTLCINYAPFVKQKSDYDCAQASLKVMGINAEGLSMNEDLGTSHENIAILLWSQKIGFTYRYNTPLTYLYHRIKDNGDLILVNYTEDGEGHYSVIMGISQDKIIIRDVWDGKIYSYDLNVFTDMWYSKMYGYKWSLAINKKNG